MIDNTGRAALCLGRRLAVTIVFSLALLLGGLIGLGMGIRYGGVVPPDLEAHFIGLRIIGFTAYLPECPPFPPCPAPKEKHYAVWLLTKEKYYAVWLLTADQPYGTTARRLLAVPLRHERN
jgi:hypothetical protein